MLREQIAQQPPMHQPIREAQPRPKPRPTAPPEEDDSFYETRSRTSTRRWQPTETQRQQIIERPRYDLARVEYDYQIPTRRKSARAAPPTRQTEEPEASPQRRHQPVTVHWLVYVGLVLILMIIGWMLLSPVFLWGATLLDDWHYGRPRTAQYDFVVGHNHDSASHPTHFIAVNLNRHVQIIEIQAGDPTHTQVLTGPPLTGPGQDLAPVTLSIEDVNGDHVPDLIVSVGDTRYVFLNDNGEFRPPKPGEPISL